MKAKYIFGLILSASLLSACTEDQMDEINTDEAHTSSKYVSGELSITDAEVCTVANTLNQDYPWYISSYTEQLFGTGNNQLKNIEVRQRAEMASSSTFDNDWNATYGNINNLLDIKKKCATGGVNSDNYALLGMEQTLEALNWGVLTDLHGDIPCSEACIGVLNPILDKQEVIYNKIFALLDSAQINLAKGSPSSTLRSHDVLNGGNMAKWEALAHALKARYLLHTYGRNKDVLPQVLTEANAAVDGGFAGCNLDVFDGSSNINTWSKYFRDREYIGCSTTVDSLMVGRDDPREQIYNYNGYGKDTVAAPGNEDLAEQSEYVNYPAWLDNGAAYEHLFSKSEIYFIIAECQARLKQDATSAFESGVEASMEDYFNTSYQQVIDNTISSDSLSRMITNGTKKYLANIKDRFTANPLNEILIQKYLAQTRDEQIETYNDMRRCIYVDGSYPIKMTNPNNTRSGSNYWPYRLPYGASDVTNIPNVAKAFGSGNDAGMYIFSNPVWWAGGND
jgi:hypothetical protein